MNNMFQNNVSLYQRVYFNLEDMSITPEVLKSLCAEAENPITEEFVNLFFMRYGRNWAIFCDGKVDEDVKPDGAKVEAWKEKFKYTYATVYKRYAKVIELYKSQESNLLNKLSTSSTVKFNDTPQEDGVGATDGYNTNITTNTTSIDPGETINRLKAISDNYQDIYYDWIGEFRFLFGEVI